jgi:hypothetical protein
MLVVNRRLSHLQQEGGGGNDLPPLFFIERCGEKQHRGQWPTTGYDGSMKSAVTNCSNNLLVRRSQFV